MNAVNRLDVLLSGVRRNPPSTSRNGIIEETSKKPSSRLTFPERESYSSTKLPSAIVTNVPLPPRRSSSSMKHHRRRHQIEQSDTSQKQYQPLLNSSTLDDLFRALTLECEQYLAAKPSVDNKLYSQISAIQSSSNRQQAVESNDDDYENLPKSRPIQSIKPSVSPLKTSIEVVSPTKRHIVSITVSSKVCPSQLISPAKSPPKITTPIITPTICPSSEDDSINISSSSTNRKRRRRIRKQIISSSTTRSSSSSTERKEKLTTEKKPVTAKRSCSTDHRCQRNKNSRDNSLMTSPSTPKQSTRRPPRRDVSLQHTLSLSERHHENYRSPLSVLLTSTKPTSDFLDHSHQRQQRRSRLESLDHKPLTSLNRFHQPFYRPSSFRNNHNNNNNNKNIPTHQISSYPVY